MKMFNYTISRNRKVIFAIAIALLLAMIALTSMVAMRTKSHLMMGKVIISARDANLFS
jgi:hypothetical protein